MFFKKATIFSININSTVIICECNGHNVPGNSKHAQTCLACRVKARNRYGCFKNYM